MRRNIRFRGSTPIDRCNRISEHGLETLRTKTDAWKSRGSSSRYLSTRQALFSNLHRVRQSSNALAVTSRGQSPPERETIQSVLGSSFSTSADPADSWNERAKQYLDSTCETKADSTSIEVATTLQTLLDDLLEITAAAVEGQKGEYTNSAAYDVQSQANKHHQYLDWISLSPYASKDNESTELSEPVPNAIDDQVIDVGLAFALMDRLVVLEQDENSALVHHTVNWTSHTSCLNPILQLWKQNYSPMQNDNQKTLPDSTYSPSKVLAKLDSYRQKSNLLTSRTEAGRVHTSIYLETFDRYGKCDTVSYRLS